MSEMGTVRKRVLLGVATALVAALVASPGAVGAQERRGERAQATEVAGGNVAPPITYERRPIMKGPLGDAVIAMNARSDGAIEIGAAGETRTHVIAVPWRGAKAWADSARRLLAARVTAKQRKAGGTARAVVGEIGGAGGGVTLTRRLHPDSVEWSLYFADSTLTGVPVPVAKEEAQLFVRAMQRAVAATTAMQPPPPKAAPKKARRPAAKRPAGKGPAEKQPAKKQPAGKQQPPPAKKPAG